MGTAKKAVATVEEKKLPVAAYDYGEDAGSGFEGTKSIDLSIPFLNVLQSNSPAVAEGTLKNGDIFNSVTGQVYEGKKGVGFQPVYHEQKYVKWKPRDAGGGILGTFDTSEGRRRGPVFCSNACPTRKNGRGCRQRGEGCKVLWRRNGGVYHG